jgi:superfamily II DNA or RNA helicase
MHGWEGTEPQFAWRRSQRALLDQLSTEQPDRRWHYCAPPGSGKTLVGLELARRIGGRTLVLAPTTAVRDQWCESVSLFGADPDTFATTDVAVGEVIPTGPTLLAVTYQLLGNPGEADDALRDVAIASWRASLEADSTALARLDELEQKDPARFRKELAPWIRNVRRTVADPDAALPAIELLGERTVALIDALVAADVTTVILDESHHLLDWWALTLAELFSAIETSAPGRLAVIGGTATLPDPDNAREAANYERLLGPVDAEIPMPALVVEGELAPWRDAVFFVEPTAQELTFLDEHQQHLVDELDEHLAADNALAWAVGSLLNPGLRTRAAVIDDETAEVTGIDRALLATDQADAAAWQALWDRDPLLAVALASWWRHRGWTLPHGLELPGEVPPFDAATRLEIVWQYVHHGTPTDHERVAITDTLKRFGIGVSVAGVRRSRTVADLVASRSPAKHRGAAEVIAHERRTRGDDLRALVVVEADTAATPAAARGVIDDAVGTVCSAASALAGHPDVLDAGVIAVSGSGWWVDAWNAESVVTAVNVDSGDGRWCSIGGSPAGGIVEIVGSGWTPGRRLAAAEAVLDAGLVHTLVATRALVGEGWDHPPLNVLVDCSDAASTTSVTQLRGRVVRLDSARPDKCASICDVVMVHPAAGAEWERARRRHRAWWGPDADGVVTTGAAKASVALAADRLPTTDEIRHHNGVGLAVLADHERTRTAWRACPPGAGATPACRVIARRQRRIAVRRPYGSTRVAGPVGGLALGTAAGAVIAVTVTAALWPVAAVLGVATAIAAVPVIPRRRSTDDHDLWAAIGAAVLDGLAAAGAADLRDAHVVAEADVEGVVVALDRHVASGDTWSAALAEMLGPVGTPRWVLCVDDEVWRVPSSIGATRAAVDAFMVGIHRRLPAAVVYRAGTPEATAAVLRAADRRRDEVDITRRWR